MTRELKFRAWNGHRMIPFEFKNISGVRDIAIAYTEKGDVCIQCDNEDHKIMQYTGLKDKNGKEIYDGDIIEVKLNPHWVERISWKGPPDAIGEVFWDLNRFAYKIRNRFDQRFTDLVDVCFDESQVIGNIYENPELLND